MVAAVDSVSSGKTGLREAARLYNLPVETLRRRVVGINEVSCRPGPPTVLSEEVEDQLARYLMQMADMGYGLTREAVMVMAFKLAEKTNARHPFKDGSAGRAWFDGFRGRHPKLTIRTPQPLSHCRALCANMSTILDFFGKLGSIYGKLNLISKPMLLINCDETSVTVVHKPGKVVAELGRRNVYSITSGEKGKTHTVLSCVSASGNVLPPMMIYPRKKAVPDSFKEGAVPNTLFATSKSGWVNSDLFIQWFEFFLQNIPPIRPVLLIQDGHSSHVSIELIELAQKNDVHLLCLPAHCTHVLQPLDVGVFKAFKSYFSKACSRYMSNNPGRVITPDKLASLVGEAWPHAFTPVNVMAGFKKTGIYPLNPGEVTDRQIGPSKVFCQHDTEMIASSDPSPPVDGSAEADAPCGSPLFSMEREALFQKRYEEGYDLFDAEYVAWLRIAHPEMNVSATKDDLSLSGSSGKTCSEKQASLSECSSTDLSDILVVPKVAPKKKKRQALNSQKTVLLTDPDTLTRLKTEQEEKERKILEKEEEKERKILEKEAKKREKDKKKKEREKRKQEKEEKIREKEMKKKVERTLRRKFADMHITEDEDNAICPKCGLAYGDDDGLWVCCDECDEWFNFECTNISDEEFIPDIFVCDSCA